MTTLVWLFWGMAFLGGLYLGNRLTYRYFKRAITEFKKSLKARRTEL